MTMTTLTNAAGAVVGESSCFIDLFTVHMHTCMPASILVAVYLHGNSVDISRVIIQSGCME